MPDLSHDDHLRHILDLEPPFAATLGVEIVSVSDGVVTAALTVGDALRNRNGVMHGGAIMAFVDCVGGTAASFHLQAGRVTSTIESKTNFLRAIRIGERIIGTCRIRHHGRTTVVLEIEIFAEDGRLAALAVQTQIVLER